MFKELLTKNNTQIPLFWAEFNEQLYKKYGKENSCVIKYHPLFKNDSHIESTLRDLVDYIRNNYDMHQL